MIVDVDEEKYKYLKIGLCDYSLLRQIIKKQYDHCKEYPSDIKMIRKFFTNYPQSGFGSPEVERFIQYVQMFINAFVPNPVTQRNSTNIFNAIYSYGNDSHDNIYFNMLKERFDSTNSEIIKSLNQYFDFETDKVKLSTFYKIPEYFEYHIKRALNLTRFDRENFMKSAFYKTYISGSYINPTSVDFDSYDIKMNQKYWDKYTLEGVAELINETPMTSLAGVEKFTRGI